MANSETVTSEASRGRSSATGSLSAVEFHNRASQQMPFGVGGVSKAAAKHTLYELALFAGAGGGILASRLLGWRTVCAVEINEYARRVLAARQDDGCLEPFPIWDDVRTFDGRPWRGIVDVVSGGFPCQDISCAGNGDGLDGERSGLWHEMARIIGEVRPRFAFVENSPLLVGRGLVRVLSDLASMGFDAEWGVVAAGDVAAPHRRERLFLVAYAADSASAAGMGCDAERESGGFPALWGADQKEHVEGYFRVRMETESLRPRVADGVAAWMDRLRCVGNGQVPLVAAHAWRLLSGRVESPGMRVEPAKPLTRARSGRKENEKLND